MKNNTIEKLKANSGQATVEAILIMSILLFSTIFVAKYFRSEKLLARWMTEPWVYIAGMAESGVWMPADKARQYHPGMLPRHTSAKDE